jgi:hypothetical protein
VILPGPRVADCSDRGHRDRYRCAPTSTEALRRLPVRAVYLGHVRSYRRHREYQKCHFVVVTFNEPLGRMSASAIGLHCLPSNPSLSDANSHSHSTLAPCLPLLSLLAPSTRLPCHLYGRSPPALARPDVCSSSWHPHYYKGQLSRGGREVHHHRSYAGYW